MNIYQLFPRLFGNKSAATTFNGSKLENGCGTFSDIDTTALQAINDMGITHIWLTGIIRHASATAYPRLGIKATNPEVTKGLAGSPYAINDYYDIDPDLATNPRNRIKEFEQLVKRIHKAGMKVIIDYVPNHLAREYHSLAKQKDIEDFGAHDNQELAFSPNNSFYYCPHQAFVVPEKETVQITEPYYEFPAKATGNNVFQPAPTPYDWYDTIKLNYGIDYSNQSNHFDPIPDTWKKMLDIMLFWCGKQVDGFRIDMAEMVPVEFWDWLFSHVKKDYSKVFIAEIYHPEQYDAYLKAGFDYLYDKVGLYNTLENILCHDGSAESISSSWKNLDGKDGQMLRFMENHDEKRLASPHFVGDAKASFPAVAVSALMNIGPFMIYNGQESGEDALGSVGYSGDDGRTSIFDYAIMPKHQKWMNGGKFDGSSFSLAQKETFDFYKRLLTLRNKEVFSQGNFYDLMWCNPWYSNFDPQNLYAFLRYNERERYLIICNFNRNEARMANVKIPVDALSLMQIGDKKKKWLAIDQFGDQTIPFSIENVSSDGISLHLYPSQVSIFQLQENKS
jgi:Glycosidases